MLNTVHFDPWQRSLFVPPVSSTNTKEKGPLLTGKREEEVFFEFFQGNLSSSLAVFISL